MDRIEVAAQPRAVMGKKVRHLRRQGKTPANLSGHGVESQPLQLDARELSIVINKQGKNSVINLRVAGGVPVLALLKDYTVHMIKNTLIHVDFQRIAAGQTLTLDLDLAFVGESPVDNRGDLLLLRLLNTVRVESLPANIPSNLEVDISGLAELDDTLLVRDLPVPEGVTILNDPEEVIARVSQVQAVPEEAEEAAEEAAAEAAEEAAAGEQPAAQAGESARSENEGS